MFFNYNYWMVREEKFISILSVIFLIKLYLIIKNYFIDFLYLLKNFKLILFYFSIIILFFPILLIIRNYYYSGSITVANNPVFLVVDYKSLYTIVTGVYLINSKIYRISNYSSFIHIYNLY